MTDVVIVDSTYRSIVVVLLASIVFACWFRAAYNKGFPSRLPFRLLRSGLLLAMAGCMAAPVFGESIVDAALLRARYGFIIPDVHPHGYGWAIVFGYAITLSAGALLVAGGVMVRLGKVPPWARGQRVRAPSPD